jgi:hypothetical protein
VPKLPGLASLIAPELYGTGESAKPIREIGCLLFDPDLRQQFGNGGLRHQWFLEFPQLFDRDDLSRANNRIQPYFFYEWLGAIALHRSTGFLSLVTRYQTDPCKSALLPSILPPAVLAVLADRSRWGKTQGPDLLMYAPDLSDWFFCECKGPGDTLSDRQHGRFADLVLAAKKPIQMLRFRAITPLRRTVQSIR